MSPVRLALRSLRQAPAVTGVVVLSLALGIGANSAIFGLADQILIRLLPVQKPRELVQLRLEGGRVGSQSGDGLHTFSHPLYLAFRDRNTVLAGLTGQIVQPASLVGDERSERVSVGMVAGNFFDVLGVSPYLGRLLHADDDRTRNENWFAYGEEVLAVADGTVIATKDGIPENVALSDKRAVPITLDTITGNLVVVDIGNGRYATFAHLIPKSLRVSVGEKVRRGQVLGLLGNSGNSDAPHLHFHVTDGSSAMGSEGVPYIFESVQHRGSVASLGKLFEDEPWIPQGGTVVRTREIPMENAVVRFR